MPEPTQSEVIAFHELLLQSLSSKSSSTSAVTNDATNDAASSSDSKLSSNVINAVEANPALVWKANEVDGITPLMLCCEDLEHTKWFLEQGG